MRILGIYKIINIINGKFYIGKATHIKGRWATHRHYLRNNKHKNIYLQNAWNKYGEEAFEFIIVEICSKENITKCEQYWIDQTKCCDRKIGYNINPNAETSLGRKFRQETKDKISAANKGNKWTEKAKDKVKGRKRPKEIIAKIIEIKRKNGTLSSLRLKESLKGNNRRREPEKWPHLLGCKCSCQECKNKRNEYVKNRNRLKEMGAWEARETSYKRKNKIEIRAAEF